MAALRSSGLEPVVRDAVESGRPFLGICVGMQLLYDGSDESPDAAGLGVLAGRVRLLPDDVKRPQMQWNQVDLLTESPLFTGLGDRPWMYFVHSYAAEPSPALVATCDYGGPVTAAVHHENVWATQFHPEKSGSAGLQLLGNFVAMAGREAAA